MNLNCVNQKIKKHNKNPVCFCQGEKKYFLSNTQCLMCPLNKSSATAALPIKSYACYGLLLNNSRIYLLTAKRIIQPIQLKCIITPVQCPATHSHFAWTVVEMSHLYSTLLYKWNWKLCHIRFIPNKCFLSLFWQNIFITLNQFFLSAVHKSATEA